MNVVGIDAERRARLEQLSLELDAAERDGLRVELLTQRLPDLSEEEAYAIAQATFERRGVRRAGYKLGYTSRAMREQMGIAQPNFGRLSVDMVIGPEVAAVEAARLVHPRVEPELTLQLGTDLRGPGCTYEMAVAAIAKVWPSLEIVDTRYQDYQFTARDNIADNSSSARCVLGAAIPFHPGLDLKGSVVELRDGGVLLAQGAGADALGDPVLALAWLADALAARGEWLRAGELVMTGGLTRAYPIAPGGHFTASFSGIGSAELRLLA